MQLVRQSRNSKEQLDRITIYECKHHIWTIKDCFTVKGQRDFYKGIKGRELHLDYGIIELNQRYRNTLYYLQPTIKIAIDKKALFALVEKGLYVKELLYEEVAISMDHSAKMEPTIEGLYSFIEAFYKCSSQREALALYEAWQWERPLNDKAATDLIRVMTFYQDEIMNYFDVKTIIETPY